MTSRNRAPRGIPEGGQFVANRKAEPEPTLSSQTYDLSPEALADSLLSEDTAPQPVHPAAFADPEQAAASQQAISAALAARHPDPEDEHVPNLPLSTHEETRAQLREVLPNLDEDEFEYRASRIELAHARSVLFSQPDAERYVADLRPSEQIVGVFTLDGYDADPAELSPAEREAYAARLARAWSQSYRNATAEAILANDKHTTT